MQVGKMYVYVCVIMYVCMYVCVRMMIRLYQDHIAVGMVDNGTVGPQLRLN